MNDIPTHAVKAVIKNDEGKFLFLQRKPDPSKKVIPSWDLPGGLVEKGEDDKSALQREIQEELGVDSVVGDEVGRWTFIRPFDGNTVNVTNYSVRLLSQDLKLSHEHTDFQWVEFSQAKELPVKDSSIFSALSKPLRIASWNIAGAHKMQSLERFDYSDEDIDYFADCLRELNPDIICLQESHTNDARSNAADIAGKLGMPFVYNSPNSPSHIDENFQLSNAIVSKVELQHIEDVVYPYPDFDLFFSDGKPAIVHNKMIQMYKYEGTTIANTQMLPLAVFGESYAHGEGAKLAESIQQILLDKLHGRFILCGDINFDTPHDIYPKFYEQKSLTEALPNTITRPNKHMVKQTPDHILISKGLEVVNADIIEVQADHYLCYTDIK